MAYTQEAPVFEEIYRDYLEQVFQLDLIKKKDNLGIDMMDGEITVPFYGITHRITTKGITDNRGCRPSHAVSVILCKYLLMCPARVPMDSQWVTYRDFKDAAPFVGGFLNSAQHPISQLFAGQLSALRKGCEKLNGRPVEMGISSDLIMRLDALPKIPLLLLFNDRDEDFPAHCSLLFENRAEKYLDMECLAMIGMVLAERLKAVHLSK